MKKNIAILILFVGAFFFGFLYHQTYRENILLKDKISHLLPSSDEIVLDVPKKDDCKVTERENIVSGESMTPFIKNGQKVKVLYDYYKCSGNVTRGDIIIYESFTTQGPIIKRIQALPGDIVKFENGKMFINGELLKNSARQEYAFHTDEVKYMNMYIQDGKLQKDAFFAFGDNVSNSIDSRKMGGLGVVNFKGKVLLEARK